MHDDLEQCKRAQELEFAPGEHMNCSLVLFFCLLGCCFFFGGGRNAGRGCEEWIFLLK